MVNLNMTHPATAILQSTKPSEYIFSLAIDQAHEQHNAAVQSVTVELLVLHKILKLSDVGW